MKLTLISPKGPLYRYRGGIFKRSLRYAPLTLSYLAALIPEELAVELTIIDEGIEAVPDRLDAELVGMTVITGSAPRAYELAARYRAQGAKVILGGPHVTLAPEDARPHADVLVVGYADDTWPELLRDHARGVMKDRYDQAPDLSLAGRPFPRRDLIPEGRYTTKNVFEATRGCAHDCEFCVVPWAWGRKPYQRPVEDVVREITAWGSKKALFIDLNLIADPRYARRLFEALIPLGIRWFGLVTSLLERDPELLDLAARSGCRGLLIGLESVSQKTLKGIHKGFNSVERYRSLIEQLHARQIALMGTFVFGLDDDETDVFEDTARFCVETGIDLPRFAVLTPFPGTALHRRLEAEGRILSRDWSLYDGQHVVHQPRHMSVKELQEGHEWVWREVYSLPNIARRIARSRVQVPLTLAANWGYRFYARHLTTHYNCDWYLGQDGAPRKDAA